jgi:hypothetical protein
VIFCGNKNFHEHWLQDDNRVKIVENTFKQILQFLEQFEPIEVEESKQ